MLRSRVFVTESVRRVFDLIFGPLYEIIPLTVFDRYNQTARMEKGNNTMLTPSEQLGL